jgi:transposase
VSGADCIALLGGWEGYTVVRAERRAATAQQSPGEVVITLAPAPGPRRCSGCGQEIEALHDVTVRWVRDLPLLDAATWLVVPRLRVACPGCGPKLDALSWLAPYARVTRRLAEQVARLCAVLPIKHVAAFFGLGWETVKAIDAAHLEATLGPIDLTDVRVIAMDEFAIQKGHRYATVVVEPLRKRVLWVGRGRSRETVRAFFELLGPAGRQRLAAVVMDMDTAFTAEVQAQCPHAAIVYDLFHVVAKYGREVIDRVRVDAANRLRQDRPARHVIKGARWLLLRNRRNLRSHADRVRLRELLAANRPLLTVYVLKDDLKHLWTYRYPGAAERFFAHWYRRAIASRLPPLQRFARALKRLLPGILAHCRWPLHTSLLEGINNKIKVLKRMAYGFRDDAYFFLKIRAAFPGIP